LDQFTLPLGQPLTKTITKTKTVVKTTTHVDKTVKVEYKNRYIPVPGPQRVPLYAILLPLAGGALLGLLVGPSLMHGLGRARARRWVRRQKGFHIRVGSPNDGEPRLTSPISEAPGQAGERIPTPSDSR
jgi:hypothetical protein